MDLNAPTALLGGLSPQAFMRRHWQKKPLLVRQALPGVTPPLARAALFDLAGSEDVESRLVQRDGGRWSLRQGPFARRTLPPASRPGWTLLVQGLDLHLPAAHELLRRFAFIPEARLDDLMLSWASDGGGVGPHLDSYDVFLIQVHGRRRWRIGPVADETLLPDMPVRLLQHFEPAEEWVLEPGDMLYLPPRWGHDGIAEGECMTASAGFRVPLQTGLARELLQRLAEDDELGDGALYRDPRQPATATPGQIPAGLREFAGRAVERLLARRGALDRALGEILSEPKPRVWFEGEEVQGDEAFAAGVALDPKSRMLYDERHVFLNGESFVAGGRDARLMRRLADERALSPRDCAGLSEGARETVAGWMESGWVRRSMR
ncbi:cupin domain-containing protein [Rubrivivax gelatinosus]|uniref:50S ribosomal protein L16 3-hydroxylase n=1 Tax=Rubrivivax gelatinosus TaxID=28068 RepID=A0A4R2MGU4_RUBGE|nr:cupin domain-containing protein [Rubrivivax gelatinosus]MBK1688070.1 cupin [Rubrivivax gelatinosus]TCP03794.1 50S ribosomal protein L16 3-hydroxylase [Rubrivivax gelatinosus]